MESLAQQAVEWYTKPAAGLNHIDRLAQRFPFVAGVLLGLLPFAVVAILV